MIAVKGISKKYGNARVLAGVSFTLEGGKKAALVGPNGVGKSTLLKIIAGQIETDRGEIEKPSKSKIGFLGQTIDGKKRETAGDYIKRLVPAEIKNHKIEVMLYGFGLDSAIQKRKMQTLSGGEKSKIALVALLLQRADILLLDEPTNNLDLPALIWLEEFIKKSAATCVIISHDRRFLDNVVSKVIELDWFTRRAIEHKGTYTEYFIRKHKELARLRKELKHQNLKIKHMVRAARDKFDHARRGAKYISHDRMLQGYHRNKSKKSAVTARVILRKVQKMEKVEVPRVRDPLVIPIDPKASEAKQSIYLKKILIRRGAFQLGPVSFEIPYGSRLAIVGPNGSGKTTLLKTISGEIKLSGGEVKTGPSLIIGSLTQEHENLPMGQALFEFIKKRVKISVDEVFHLLRRFDFTAGEARKKISELSPGGRARLLFAYFAAISANVLVLDEPTNHLDLDAIEALEEILENYKGTVIIVSHDRYFLNKASLTSTYMLENGSLSSVESYEEYEDKIIKNTKRLLKQIR